jgi:hypothetical protein
MQEENHGIPSITGIVTGWKIDVIGAGSGITYQIVPQGNARDAPLHDTTFGWLLGSGFRDDDLCLWRRGRWDRCGSRRH